ncbi:MAG: DEAD/DEAH box helicase [Paludibacteraceae bacterium]|nr:DEAD/DEAH box helicase [Paludibacteraceae bacterium]
MTFQDLGLREELVAAISRLGFEQPTPIQEQAIPFLLSEQRDLIALAQTGTGKTAAFGLPVLNQIDERRQVVQCLVLSPTRELCMQIAKDLRNYAADMAVRIVAVYGGEDIRVQLRQLDQTPQIIVATPGRLIDLCGRGKVVLDEVGMLVLDEADEMLDMGFKDDIEQILSQTPQTRRTMLFSATMPPDIARMAGQYMHDPHEITIGTRNSGTENVDHIYYICKATQRYLVLKRIVDMNPDIYGIVFCRTREETKDVAERLMKDGYNADALHGDLTQAARDAVMRKFRERTLQLLVATDVAARGLDVSDLTHVINYNLPDDIEVYTHRSGRTGRIGKRGISVSIIHSREKHRIRSIERMLKRSFTQEPIPSGMDVCRKQLFNFISRMQHVEVDDDQIAPYMPEVMAMLEYLDTQEIIKRFVSLEFNRFIDYYRDAPDLNLPASDSSGKSAAERGTGSKRSGERIRMKLNIGHEQHATPKMILGIINRVTHDRDIIVRDIEIARRYTFFSIFADQAERLKQGFKDSDEFDLSEVKGRRAADDRPVGRQRDGRQMKHDRTGGSRRPARERQAKQDDWQQFFGGDIEVFIDDDERFAKRKSKSAARQETLRPAQAGGRRSHEKFPASRTNGRKHR